VACVGVPYVPAVAMGREGKKKKRGTAARDGAQCRA